MLTITQAVAKKKVRSRGPFSKVIFDFFPSYFDDEASKDKALRPEQRISPLIFFSLWFIHF